MASFETREDEDKQAPTITTQIRSEAQVDCRSRAQTAQTIMFSLDGSDYGDCEEVGSTCTDREEDEFSGRAAGFGAHRLSFMFEHNNLINIRIQALANELRNGNLLAQFKDDDEDPPGGECGRNRVQSADNGEDGTLSIIRKTKTRRRSGVSTPRMVQIEKNAEPEIKEFIADRENAYIKPEFSGVDSEVSSKSSQGARRRRKSSSSAELSIRILELEQRNQDLEQLLEEARKSSIDKGVESALIGLSEEDLSLSRIGSNNPSSEPSMCSTKSCKASEVAENSRAEKWQDEAKRSRQQVEELLAEIKTEKARASQSEKEIAGLRRDLKKCQHVIERLVGELEMATAAPKNDTLAPKNDPFALQANPDTSSDVHGEEDRRFRNDSVHHRKAARPSTFMSDLSSAIGSFFGQLGQPNNSLPQSLDECSSSSEFDDAFCWAEEPRGRNVDIADDGQTAYFIGNEKTKLHAYVVTEEPPLLEADQGYGFEILIIKVSIGHEDGLAIGFTATSPDMWPEELPESADLIEQTWLVGYNGEMYDGGTEEWHHCPWSPASLKEGDRVGVQVSMDGRFCCAVNQKVVYRSNIPLISDGPHLFGVVDLHGNTEAVRLLD